MGKITVRHILNKKVKPKFENGDKYFTVYLQIIYNQFSTEKRSSTGILITESNFERYINGLQPIEKEIITSKKWNGVKELNNEIKDARNSLEVIENYGFEIKRNEIFNVVKELSRPMSTLLIEVLRNNIQSGILDKTVFNELDSKPVENTDYEEFLLSFNGNIIDSLEKIESYTGVNIRDSIKQNDLIRFKTLKIIFKMYSGCPFSEFVISDYETTLKDEMKNETLEQFETTLKDVEKWIDDGIQYIKILFGKI